MLIKESHVDVPTKASGQDGSMRIYVFHPTVPGYPNARFPGVVVFSEIYQVTGPVARFARQIAGQGYICVAPSSYHEFTGPEALKYDAEDTDKGNLWKISKKVAAYDEDASLSVDYLLSLPTCNGRVGATGMCLGGHLAYRCALDQRVKAAVCYFATDIHSATLGEGKKDDSLARAGDIKGELVMIFGKNDNHVPPEGRDLIRKTLHDKGVLFSFYEVAWAQHAFIRDELSKGRYDPAISKTCFEMLLELFGRTLKLDLGDHDGKEIKIENSVLCLFGRRIYCVWYDIVALRCELIVLFTPTPRLERGLPSSTPLTLSEINTLLIKVSAPTHHEGKSQFPRPAGFDINDNQDPLAQEEILTRQTDIRHQRDLYRIQRGPRIVYLSLYGFDVLPSQQGGDPDEIMQDLSDLLPIWRRTEWHTAIVCKNPASGEIESQTDLVAPHCMDRNVLRVLELCPVYINVLDLIEVKRLKDRVSRVALLQEPTNIPIFMIMKMASFAREVRAVQREVEVYAHLFATAANNLAPDFLGYVYEEHEDRVVGFLMEDFEGRWANADDLEECTDIVTDLHNAGIIHGDLRPSNFLVHEDFGVRVIDFEYAEIHRSGNAFVDQDALQKKKVEEICQLETMLLGSPGPSVA